MDRFEKGGRVEVNPQLFDTCVSVVEVRYVLDFGIVRKMVFDEERAMQCRVLLHHLGTPEQLLGQLIDSPPQQRIETAAQNLRDLGALKGEQVASLGRIAVFMPTTIQLTKLIVLSWALGIPADGIVIAAALSTQDVFKMAAPANCRNLEDFPAHLSHNYITRARFDAGQFSEPIM
ncbi:ATP-dependent RNA helicase TDRD9 (Tudor domain-containing protein 9) [Durusdinium trenchii]|uniref:ATP-dependent RNA helicase TDRD9 (Tudor domain-containing protein 9) n=1 Tax=Durusdinium trenchii TaxID=1381693 RepID=A0ABP0I6V5_9DINO